LAGIPHFIVLEVAVIRNGLAPTTTFGQLKFMIGPKRILDALTVLEGDY
jgi:hypothetical protein